jgi:hypothetical protein
MVARKGKHSSDGEEAASPQQQRLFMHRGPASLRKHGAIQVPRFGVKAAISGI